MSFAEIEDMKNWKEKDWADAWKGGIQTELQDDQGKLINMTSENIEDVKAQLAINTFATLVQETDISENIEEIAIAAAASDTFNLDKFLNQHWSVSLDSYSRLVGNWMKSEGLINGDIKNFDEYVKLSYGTSYETREIAEAWNTTSFYGGDHTWTDITAGVDLLSRVGGFEAGQIAAQLGTSLQQVADTIAEAASIGIGTDLEGVAQGLGYGSFADAVAAYNAQYGTNYTPEEAAEALGN